MKANGLKPLRPVKAKPGKRERCEHYWAYEHAIYSISADGIGDGIGVHRQCDKCGIHELCKIPSPRWTRNVKGFALTDMRKA